jgi:hypothetical protein
MHRLALRLIEEGPVRRRRGARAATAERLGYGVRKMPAKYLDELDCYVMVGATRRPPRVPSQRARAQSVGGFGRCATEGPWDENDLCSCAAPSRSTFEPLLACGPPADASELSSPGHPATTRAGPLLQEKARARVDSRRDRDGYMRTASLVRGSDLTARSRPP